VKKEEHFMKKWLLFLSLYVCLCLTLGACGDVPQSVSCPAVSAGTVEPVNVLEPTSQVTKTFRLVGSSDRLLLAEVDGGRDAVYDIDVSAEAEHLAPGTLVDVTWSGATLEMFPGQFAGETSITVREDGFDDRCRLYLDVLEDLWTVDEGLNSSGMEYVGVDLSQTSLPESERSAVAWLFGEKHGVHPLQETYEELQAHGYITGEPLEGTDAKFWHWENGCLFSITEKEDAPVTFGSSSVTFDAQKWRSGLGAYFFCDCTASRGQDGAWGQYTIGSEAIS